MIIIDTHVHIYDPHRPEGAPWPPEDSSIYRTVLPADCRAVAEPEGVSGVVVVEASERISDNDWILGLAAEEPPGPCSTAAQLWLTRVKLLKSNQENILGKMKLPEQLE